MGAQAFWEVQTLCSTLRFARESSTMKVTLALLAFVPLAALAVPFAALKYPACASGFTCGTISPADKPGLSFDCAWIRAVDEIGVVLYAHGNDGKLSKGMFFETMSQVATLGYSGLSCDQRGYSPGAAPDDMAAYNYDILASDLFSLMDATNFSAPYGGKFHMVAHDQGARVSWHAIAKGGTASEGRKRFLSFTSLSIPHSDVFSDALLGPLADYDAQVAQQYVRMLVLPNSTLVDSQQIYNVLCKSGGWTDISTCQKTLWCYGSRTHGTIRRARGLRGNSVCDGGEIDAVSTDGCGTNGEGGSRWSSLCSMPAGKMISP